MLLLNYLSGYPQHLQQQVQKLIEQDTLGKLLLNRYPTPHQIRNDKSLYLFTAEIKNQYLRNAAAIDKVSYSSKIQVLKHALGLHHAVSRIQGGKLKAKAEIQIASVFKTAPVDFLRMIVVHELAHLKEKEHNKAFYNLCCHMEPNYHQLEFDTRLYLTYLDIFGSLYHTE